MLRFVLLSARQITGICPAWDNKQFSAVDAAHGLLYRTTTAPIRLFNRRSPQVMVVTAAI
jgi:hypothetical protein